MALPGSGAISIGQIATEFGGGAPHSLNEYYRNGSLVPNYSQNSGIATSGAINMNGFHGASDVAPSWSTTLTIGSIAGKIPEYGYGSQGAGQNQNPTYGSVSDNTVDILGGAFFRTCKSAANQIWVEIDGGSTAWSSIKINATTIARTSMTKDVDQWRISSGNIIGTSGNITVTINP
jgi:hypothetical protein